MAADHKVLAQLLKNMTKSDKTVATVMDRLSALSDIARRGSFDLCSVHSADENAIVSALASATRQKVRGTVLISVRGRSGGTGTLSSDEFFLLRQGMNVGESLWRALWDKNQYWLREGFRGGPGLTAKTRLETALRLSLGNALESAVWATLKGVPIWEKQRACISNGIWDCMVYYVGFTVVGDAERAGRIEPLLRQLSRLLFVSCRKEEPQSWIVLVS